MSALDKDFTAQYSTALADSHMFTYCDTTIEMSKLLQHIYCAIGQMEECVYIAVSMHVCILAVHS